MPRECLRTNTDLTVLKLLFDSDVMLLVGRLLIVAGAIVMLTCGLFVLVSMTVRMKRGHWLRRAGPFEVSDTAAREVDQVAAALEETTSEQRERIAALETQLSVWTKTPGDTHD